MFAEKPNQFDLVFTDQTMPKMTGTQLSHKIQEIKSDVPIILATGYSDAISEETARAIGIRQFLMKPVKIDKLTPIIQKFIDN